MNLGYLSLLIRDRVGVGVRSDVLGHRTQKAERPRLA